MRRKYRDLIDQVRQSVVYWRELAEMEFTNDIERLMREDNISRAEMAGRLDSSQAYVTQVLSGNRNFTLKTMVKLARALDGVLHIRIAREGEIVEIKRPVVETDVAASAVDLPSAQRWVPDPGARLLSAQTETRH